MWTPQKRRFDQGSKSRGLRPDERAPRPAPRRPVRPCRCRVCPRHARTGCCSSSTSSSSRHPPRSVGALGRIHPPWATADRARYGVCKRITSRTRGPYIGEAVMCPRRFDRPRTASTFAHLDATTVLSRGIAEKCITRRSIRSIAPSAFLTPRCRRGSLRRRRQNQAILQNTVAAGLHRILGMGNSPRRSSTWRGPARSSASCAALQCASVFTGKEVVLVDVATR